MIIILILAGRSYNVANVAKMISVLVGTAGVGFVAIIAYVILYFVIADAHVVITIVTEMIQILVGALRNCQMAEIALVVIVPVLTIKLW